MGAVCHPREGKKEDTRTFKAKATAKEIIWWAKKLDASRPGPHENAVQDSNKLTMLSNKETAEKA